MCINHVLYIKISKYKELHVDTSFLLDEKECVISYERIDSVFVKVSSLNEY